MSRDAQVPTPLFPPKRWSFSRQSRSKLGAVLLLMAMVAAACGASGEDSVATSSLSAAADDAADAMVDMDSSGPTYALAQRVTDGNADSAGADRMFAPAAEAPPIAPEAEPVSGDASPNLSGSAGGEPVAAQLPDIGRDIIYTATLELASTDVSTATRDAIRAVEARGGFLFSQETTGGANGRSVLTFKVLPDQFQAVLSELGSVGNVRSQSISADDVTAVVVDLESRINTAEASVLRLRALLDGATELDTIATLENQLLQRETSLEQLRGQLRMVQDQVDLATITVFVTELLNRPAVSIEAMTFAGHDAGFSCFDAGRVSQGETGDPITTCYRITNTGDTPLVDVVIDDPSTGATVSSMVLVDGDITQIDPGESVTLAHEFEIESDLKLRTVVTATGLDQNGDPLDDEVKATAGTMRLNLLEVEDDGFPSFGEVLGRSWDALVTAAIVIALVAVAIAPFAAAALVLGFIGLKLYRRMPRTPRVETIPPAPTPPPPSSDAENKDDADAEDDADNKAAV